MGDKADECVKVVVRVRPLSRKEKQDGHEANTKADPARGTIIVENPKGDDGEPPKSFTFDFVFGADTQQKGLYDKAAARTFYTCHPCVSASNATRLGTRFIALPFGGG